MNKEELLDYFMVDVPFGDKSLTIAIGEFSFTFSGFDKNLKDFLEKEYYGFIVSKGKNPLFEVNVAKLEKEIAITNEDFAFFKFDDIYSLIGSYFIALRKNNAKETKLLILDGNKKNVLFAVENFMRFMISNAALSKNGLLLHASSKVIKDRSHIFLGNHGAGKTTAVSLIDEGFTIADDVVLIMPDSDGYKAHSMPSISKFEQKKEEIGSFKVEAFYKLIKSNDNKMKKMSKPCAFAILVASVPFVSGTNRHHYISKNIIEKIPFFNLYFRKEKNFFNEAKVNI